MINETTKYFVFGDTGGHLAPLQKALTSLGVDVINFTIPENVTIIHTGDLIHKGPASSKILQLVDNLMVNNPGQWVQILGNHEYQHLGGPQFWNCSCSVEDKAILRKWVESGQATPAFALTTDQHLILDNEPYSDSSNQWLFTHGGVTQSFFERLGTSTAEETAEVINLLLVKYVTWPGELLYGKPHPLVGCVWAIGATEVYPSWNTRTEPLKFNQIYGHTTSFLWKETKWRYGIPKEFKTNSVLAHKNRAVITKLPNQNLMVGIDPGYENYATQKSQSYITLGQNL